MIHEASPFKLCNCGVLHREPFERADPTAWRRQFRNLFLTNTLKNLMLGAVATASATNPDFGSLHTAYSTTGTNEVTGGSPAYARVALTWAAPSGGSVALAATLPTWNVPSGTTVGWWGGWDAVTSGTFLFMLPLGAGTLRPASVEVAGDLTSNVIFTKAHGYVVDSRVVLWGTLPTGSPTPAVGTIYYVGTVPSADSFTLSTTAANANPVDITGTAPYNFLVQSVVPQTTVTQDTIQLNSASIDLSVVA